MDKIEKELSGDLKVTEARAEMMMRMMEKIDELVEGYKETMRRLDRLESRMEALSSIAIKGRNEY